MHHINVEMKKQVVALACILITVNFMGLMVPSFNATGMNNTGWYRKPDSYAQLVTWYKNLEENYSRYIEVFKANELYGTGKVDGGYDLYYVRITNESQGLHKPEVLFLGSPHGDETAGTIGMYWFTDWLMRQAYHPDFDNPERDWYQWIIDNREIYLEVSHNPYGFDHIQRGDYNGWDLNREADYHGPGPNTGGIWASVNGLTLKRFIDNHLIRIGTDFHGGVRMLLYPWSSTYDAITGTSPLSNMTYTHAPPDFYYYDVTSLRVGNYIGDFGGDLNPTNCGTIPDTVGYEAPGAIAPWAYGADIQENPAEDQWVSNEKFGNYPGAGILWITPELSVIKNPSEITMGSDQILGYGTEVRRFLLHQIDLAQPYIWWLSPTNNSLYSRTVTLQWQVNGCHVVDETLVQWGMNPDPINAPDHVSRPYTEHQGDYVGGTGWDNALDGDRTGRIYWENITFDEPGDYYFVAKAQVDQAYKDILVAPEYASNRSYLRLIKERTNGSYLEELNGTDGQEYIEGQLWWYSPIVHVHVGAIERPREGYLYVANREIMPTVRGKTVVIGDIVVSVSTQNTSCVEFYVDGNLRGQVTTEPYEWRWEETIFGNHELEVKIYGRDYHVVSQTIPLTIFNIA